MKAKWQTDFLTGEITEPIDASGLQIFGLKRNGASGLVYTTLDEALAAGNAEVLEVSESGSVPHLKFVNRSDTQVFIMAGEHLVGAKQNRVLNASLMVPARSELVMDVSCVESGRWNYASREFRSSGTLSHSKLRKIMMKQSSFAFRERGRPLSDQGAVWNEVDRKLCAMGSVSPSEALVQAYDDSRAKLESIEVACHVPADCCGAVFALHGRIAGLELFDKPSTLAQLWPKLLRSYAIDALELPANEERILPGKIAVWLGSASQATTQSFKSPGVGEDVRFDGEDVVGACLVVDNQLVHAELFPEDARLP